MALHRMRRVVAQNWPRTRSGIPVLPSVAGLGFAVLMVPAWWDAARGVDSPMLLLVLGAGYLLGCLLAVPLTHRAPPAGVRAVCFGLVAWGLVLVVLAGLDHSWVVICGLLVTTALLPWAVSLGVTSAVVVGIAAWAASTTGLGVQVSNLTLLVSCSLAAALVVRLAETNEELQRARDEIALFAVVKERERFARDLHDILGHSLTTITVKAALARRIGETGQRAGALVEIGDVERLARQALQDVRATVAEYREVSLSGELVAANEILAAAGMRGELPHAVDHVEPELQRVFGYVLREAVTNAVRHSGAGRVDVRWGRNWIVVRDDGTGVPGPEGAGLAGLRGRVREIGGALSAASVSAGGFEVRAEVPLDAEVFSGVRT